jgi:hypothetical protein
MVPPHVLPPGVSDRLTAPESACVGSNRDGSRRMTPFQDDLTGVPVAPASNTDHAQSA